MLKKIVKNLSHRVLKTISKKCGGILLSNNLLKEDRGNSSDSIEPPSLFSDTLKIFKLSSMFNSDGKVLLIWLCASPSTWIFTKLPTCVESVPLKRLLPKLSLSNYVMIPNSFAMLPIIKLFLIFMLFSIRMFAILSDKLHVILLLLRSIIWSPLSSPILAGNDPVNFWFLNLISLMVSLNPFSA